MFNGNAKSLEYEDIFLTFYVNPFMSKEKNIIMIEFQKPISIALINIYNYIKDANRGTKEVEIFLDNYLIYTGHLNHPDSNALSSIVFSNFMKLSHKKIIPISQFEESNHIELINEGKVIQKKKEKTHVFRPFTGKIDENFN